MNSGNKRVKTGNWKGGAIIADQRNLDWREKVQDEYDHTVLLIEKRHVEIKGLFSVKDN
ncbi:hypothetical protein [Sphingobacterium sp.]|uniref:hypothetical protein n=1 Tax=Sphingobacterium sp. TaxID=341027 RepID=UPI002FDB3D49